MRIKELLHNMQIRPKMYVREVRMDYIFHFLMGYCGGENAKLPDDSMDRKFCCWFGKWLIPWIENNVDANYRPTSAAWYDDIIRITPDGQNEVDLFFDLCEKFFEDYENKTGYFSWRNETA